MAATPFVAENTIAPVFGGPWHLAGPVGPARPDVDDRLAVDVDRQGSAAEAAAGKQPGEDADDVCEPRVGGSLHAARQALFSAKKRRRRHRPNNAAARTHVGANRDIQPTSRRSRAQVDRVEYLDRVLERRGGDSDLAPERMVETVDDEQQQAEQNRDGAGQHHVGTCAVQPHEGRQPDQQHATEDQAAPQQPRDSRFGVQYPGVSLRGQTVSWPRNSPLIAAVAASGSCRPITRYISVIALRAVSLVSPSVLARPFGTLDGGRVLA